MTTARDLLIVAMDKAPSRPVERGDLSLALAGAELIDLLDAQAVTLDGERIVPGYRPTIADRLLDDAASSLVREPPYESIDDWLWRRGRDLSAAYVAALESEGQLTRPARRKLSFRSSQMVLADSPARRQATERWATEEPVLTTLGTAVGVRGKEGSDAPSMNDDAVTTVLAGVHNALMELEAVRQRRAIEEAAFDNVWRGE
ncbi:MULTISPECIES: GPP34 family phosphoprotein [unclassified Streptomyces]|uniref:GOLPH3/VPS74 family protein n=1 Tax=unclassified Streptomyces TaxID=2593676 RepID=UPI0037FBF9E2